MGESFVVAVKKSIHKLGEKVSSLVFGKGSRHGNEIKDLTTTADLKDDVVNLLLFSRLTILWVLFIYSSSDLNLFNYMIVFVNLLHSLSFSSDEIHQFLITVLDDLDGYFPSGIHVDTELDFA